MSLKQHINRIFSEAQQIINETNEVFIDVVDRLLNENNIKRINTTGIVEIGGDKIHFADLEGFTDGNETVWRSALPLCGHPTRRITNIEPGNTDLVNCEKCLRKRK